MERKESLWAALATSLLVLPVACGDEGVPLASPDELRIDASGEKLLVNTTLLWDQGEPIAVCFTNPEDWFSAESRGWVQEALAESWSLVSSVSFTGFGTCPPGATFNGISIEHNDGSDISSAIGKQASVSSKPSMSLSSTYTNPDRCDKGNQPGSHTSLDGREWESARKWCVFSQVQHEFGHALGFYHEYWRHDYPEWCYELLEAARANEFDVPQYAEGGGIDYVAFWDDWSIMDQGYCAITTGRLSPSDIYGAKLHYGFDDATDYIWRIDGDIKKIVEAHGRDPEFRPSALLVNYEAMNIGGAYDPVSGDFDGDGWSDIFWYRPGGSNFWYTESNGAFDKHDDVFSNLSYDRTLVVGNFDGAYGDDIFVYDTKHQDVDWIWWSTGDRDSYALGVPDQVAGNYEPFGGDFDGDGRGDIYWYRIDSADSDYIWFGNSDQSFTTTPSGALNMDNGVTPIPGDFDGDGGTDIIWYRAGTSFDDLWWSTKSRTTYFSVGSVNIDGTYQPVVGDFDGSGTDDVIWNRSEGRDYLWLWSTTRGTYETTGTSIYGTPAYPVVGKFGCDGGDLCTVPTDTADDIFFYLDAAPPPPPSSCSVVGLGRGGTWLFLLLLFCLNEFRRSSRSDD